MFESPSNDSNPEKEYINFNNLILFINDDISYFPKLKINQNEFKISSAPFNLFFKFVAYDLDFYYLIRFYNFLDYEICCLNSEKAKTYCDFFNKNKEIVLKGEQPIWKIDKIVQNPIYRRLYPAFVTSIALFGYYHTIKQQYEKQKRDKETMEALGSGIKFLYNKIFKKEVISA